MAATVTFDTIQRGAVQQQGLATRVLRGVSVTGIPSALTLSDPDVLMAAQTAVASAAGANYPSRADLFFVGLSIQGITNDGVQGYAIYESFQGQAPSSAILRNKSYVTSVRASVVPGTREPIKTRYIGNGVFAGIKQGWTPAECEFLVPVTSIEASGLKYGDPVTGGLAYIENYVGYVNDAAWGPAGRGTKPKGYWMIVEYEDQVSRYSGYYTYRVSLAAKNYEDWSVYQIIKHRQTGQYVVVDDGDAAATLAADYKQGIIIGTNEAYGLVRVGGNPTVDFTSIGL